MAKGGLARERFREKQQYNRIVAQLEKLRAAGNTTEDIRAAGPNAWKELEGWNIKKDPLTGQWAYEGAAPGGVTDPASLAPTGTNYAQAPAWANQSYYVPGGGLANPNMSAAPGTTPNVGGTKIIPSWYNNSVAGGRTNVTPTRRGGLIPNNPPAWLPGWATRGAQVLGNGLLNMGLSQFIPMSATPFITSIMNGIGANRSTRVTASYPGARGTRPVDANTGIPDFQAMTQTGPQFSFGGSGGGNYTPYKKRRGRGGGGGRGTRQPIQQQQPGYEGYVSDNAGPAWSRGLANWGIG